MILGFQKTAIAEDERFELRRVLVCRYRSQGTCESSAEVCAVSMYHVFKATALKTDTSVEYLHERDPSDHQTNRAALYRSAATTLCLSQWKADKGNTDVKALPMGGFLKVPCVNMWEQLIAFCTICFLYSDPFTVGIVPLFIFTPVPVSLFIFYPLVPLFPLSPVLLWSLLPLLLLNPHPPHPPFSWLCIDI